MTAYLNSYVKEMLEKHPCGKEFVVIRDLCRSDVNPKVITDMHWIVRLFAGPSNRNPNRYKIKAENRVLCCAEAAKRSELLIANLDRSENSKWLVQYLLDKIDVGRYECHDVIMMFERYLTDCLE